MVSPHVQQLFWVEWINAIKHHPSLVEALKRVSLMPTLQVRLFCFSFYKGVKGGSPVCVCVCVCFPPVFMKREMH